MTAETRNRPRKIRRKLNETEYSPPPSDDAKLRELESAHRLNNISFEI